MLRGRRVFFVCIFYLLIFCSFSKKLLAIEKNSPTTIATTSPSINWQMSIAQESQTKIESQLIEINQPIKISIYNLGLNQTPLAYQNILITIIYKGKIINQQKLVSNNKGVIGFAYVPAGYGDYQFKFENITYVQPITLKSEISFKLYPSPINSLTSLLIELLSPKY